MPNGKHWEWRGFGRVSDSFRTGFEQLPLKFQPPWDDTKDEYVWIPGVQINVKLRSGGQQQGLKLKRFVSKDRDLELWFEDPKELFPFSTLDASALQGVGAILGISLPAPTAPPTRETVLDALLRASPTPVIVTISKRRQTRVRDQELQVELAEIIEVTVNGAPVPVQMPLFSVAIENGVDLTGADRRRLEAARDDVDTLVNALQLRGGTLRTMNYLQIIGEWLSMT
jgi:hypothetical protein